MADRQTLPIRLGILLALGLLAAACGTPFARPSPTPTAVPSPTPTPQPLLAVVDQGNPLNTLLLINLSGQPVAQTLISKTAVIAGTTATEVAYEDGGRLQALQSNGQVTVLGSMDGFKGGRVVLSPNGKQWMWSTYNVQGSQVHSFIYLDDRLVADDVLQGRFFEPVAWTQRGVVFEQAEMGLGGYQPFDLVTGKTLLLQPQDQSAGNSPQGTNLTPQACLYGDLADDGSVVCRVPSGDVVTSTASLQFTLSTGDTFNLTLPPDQFTQAGAISFLPSSLQTSGGSSGGQAVVGGATLAGAGTGGQGEVYQTAIIDLAARTLTPLPTPGLRPGAGAWAWLSATELITYRPAGAAGGAPGIYIASTTKPAVLLWPQGTPVGLLDQNGASSQSPQPSPSGSANPSGII